MNNQVKGFYFVIGVLSVLLVLAVVGGGRLNRSASGSPASTGALSGSETGRYQMTSAGTGVNPYVFILDTKTGRCWLASSPGDPFKEVTPPIRP